MLKYFVVSTKCRSASALRTAVYLWFDKFYLSFQNLKISTCSGRHYFVETFFRGNVVSSRLFFAATFFAATFFRTDFFSQRYFFARRLFVRCFYRDVFSCSHYTCIKCSKTNHCRTKQKLRLGISKSYSEIQ